MDNVIYELDSEELKWWMKKIILCRKKIVKSPKEYVNEFVKNKGLSLNSIKEHPSESIEKMRQGCWELYLKDEVNFHREILKVLISERNAPQEILNTVINSEIKSNSDFKGEALKTKIANIVGDYSGRIMPYIYALSLSTTNSRRSRSGKTFEGVIEYILDIYKYPYDNQSKIGTDFYKTRNIGKMVDCIIPNKESYEANRAKCMIITMKTSLRERWQEVAEEISRTNIPHIYLLTVDKILTEGVLKNIKQQNMTIVTYDNMKSKFNDFKNIISFETFFNKEIPQQLVYWKD